MSSNGAGERCPGDETRTAYPAVKNGDKTEEANAEAEELDGKTGTGDKTRTTCPAVKNGDKTEEENVEAEEPV